ncbi:MAG TPA: hypothetical protein DCY94_05415 [Firmicutes bacterium]|nr:hypothetical protein [Bacillota bacterium]
MEEILLHVDEFITTVLTSLGVYGPILGCLLILVESILPMLPLSVFITLNFYSFGHLVGFIISYILTLIGCNFAFFLCRKLLRGRFDHLVKRFDKNKALKMVKRFSNIKLKHLALILAFPFTPAFAINIFAGVSDMNYKKFLAATAIAKPFMVYFWGYLGVTLLDSLTHPTYLFRVVAMLAIAYGASAIINKKFELD